MDPHTGQWEIAPEDLVTAASAAASDHPGAAVGVGTVTGAGADARAGAVFGSAGCAAEVVAALSVPVRRVLGVCAVMGSPVTFGEVCY